MKKRLEAELISIAHRVLKLKNKSEVDQLFTETQKLYEALSVLKFYGDYIEQVPQPEIGQEALEEKLADSLEGKAAPKLDNETKSEMAEEKKQIVSVAEEAEAGEAAAPTVIVGEIQIEDEEDDLQEELTSETPKEEVDADAIFEMASETTPETTAIETPAPKDAPEKANPTKQISFEDFLGDSYKDVEFVKPNDITAPAPVKEEEKEIPVEEPATEEEQDKKPEPPKEASTPKEPAAEKSPILNEKLAAGINIGLNDRVGFVKYLFDDSSEDFNRVLSQLNTFDNFAEAEEFINDMVKPDYNNWQGNEDYAERFMDIVGQKFK